MKFLASIFLLYFTSLMVQPMVTLLHNELTKEKQTCTMACCEKHKQSEKKQARKLPFGCCANDLSNPFAQCCCCIGFIAEQQNTELTILQNSTALTFINTKDLIPNYYSDCWRPPKMAA